MNLLQPQLPEESECLFKVLKDDLDDGLLALRGKDSEVFRAGKVSRGILGGHIELVHGSWIEGGNDNYVGRNIGGVKKGLL